MGCIRPDVRLRVLLAGGPAARVLDLVFRAGAAGLTAARALLALRFLLCGWPSLWAGGRTGCLCIHPRSCWGECIRYSL